MASIDVRHIFDNAVQAQYGEDGARYFASTAWTALRDQLEIGRASCRERV